MDNVKIGQLIAEGKTKKVWGTNDERYAIIESKDDLTAGDGAKHDIIAGKAALANRTTSNVFKLLNQCGISTAFVQEIDGTKFLSKRCEMIPYEVVVRREAHGSFLKRHPELQKGACFSSLVVELFLKTSGKRWKDAEIPKDDPLILIGPGYAELYLPDKPIYAQDGPFLTLKDFPLSDDLHKITHIKEIAARTFLVLEKAWQNAGGKLVDFKVEFGFDPDGSGSVILADVIDNDSWRVIFEGDYIDKQLYRDGKDLNTVTAKYKMVSELTDRFSVPSQQIVLWRASESDNMDPFREAITQYLHGADWNCEVAHATCSLHKEPIRACNILAGFIQKIPDTVIVVFCGRSNGAGPTLAAQCTVPVITVPASWKEFPEDVWSSLRAPSEVPVMTVLDPKNAVLAAMQILSMRNPAIYANLRFLQEKRLGWGTNPV